MEAEAARTNSQQQPMTAEEKAAKQAFIEEMLSTWTSASQAEDANNSSKTERRQLEWMILGLLMESISQLNQTRHQIHMSRK